MAKLRSKVYRNIGLIAALAVWIVALAGVDRLFFKRSSSFSCRFIYSCLPNDPKWDLPPLSDQQEKLLQKVLGQKFHYLAKGNHCFAFISEDQKYVLKFHRYPSHLRIFPWLHIHALSYQWSQKRKKIKAHNLDRLESILTSYRNSYLDLQEETGVLAVHINRTNNLKKTVTLIDNSHAEHKVRLDDATFILQHKAELIYPRLAQLMQENRVDEAKKILDQIIQLITSSSQKGYIDQDSALHRNYGLLTDRAIHIDVGDLVEDKSIQIQESYLPYIAKTTESLAQELCKNYPELFKHWNKRLHEPLGINSLN